MTTTITETCRCGASISVPSSHTASLDKFRANHAVCLTPPTTALPEDVRIALARHEELLAQNGNLHSLHSEAFSAARDRMDLIDQCLIDHIENNDRHTEGI